jgi:microcystin-dependent protein
MAEPFIGEIRLLPWNWPPKGWALCNGALLPINQYTALFSLLGTTYGGDGIQTFGLPDLRGRTPIHMGPVYTQGELYGQEQVTITTATMPGHGHTLSGVTTAGNSRVANAHYLASVNPTTNFAYATNTTPIALNASATSQIGGNEPHNNMQPFLVLNYSIALVGYFPSRN